LEMALKRIFEFAVSPADRIADNDKVGIYPGDVLFRKSVEVSDIMGIEVGAHGRVKCGVGTADGMAGMRERDSN